MSSMPYQLEAFIRFAKQREYVYTDMSYSRVVACFDAI